MVFETLSPKLREWLKEKNISTPTKIQEIAIPEVSEGNDSLLIAKTGHGKTLAAILPIFNKMLEKKEERVKTLYITPLKSLNRDIFDRVLDLANNIGLEVDLRHGDTPKRERREQVIDPPNMMIITPETLQAILTGSKLRELLSNVEYVIIDEIHELCENKRGTQLSIGLERLREVTGKEFQRVALSATIGDSKKISKFLNNEKECRVLEAGAKKNYDISIEMANPSEKDKEIASDVGITRNSAYTLRKIKELVDESESTIVFVNTRETAEALSRRFKKWKPDLPISVHHSSLSKDVRVKGEDAFRKGETKAIITTSSLELGIDIGSVDLVIQYGSPRRVTKLVQRVGRSGHGIDRISKGFLISTSIDDFLESKAILKLSEEDWLEEPVIPEKCFDVLAHQIVGISMETEDCSFSDVYNIVKRAYPYRNLEESELRSLIGLLKDARILTGGKNKVWRTRKGLKYYYENLSTIPNEKEYLVIDSEINERVGILHQGFVAKRISKNSNFIMNGESWKVVEIDGNKIKAVRSKKRESAVPSWEGEMIPVAYSTSKLASRLRDKYKDRFEDLKDQEKYTIPTPEKLLLESKKNISILHSPFGSKVNKTFSKVLGAVLSSKLGSSVGARSDPYRVIIQLPKGHSPQIVMETLSKLKPEWIDDLIRKSIKNTRMFEYRFFQIAKRMGIIAKDADYSFHLIKRLINTYENTVLIEETKSELLREKIDIERTRKVFEEVSEGKIEIVKSKSSDISPLGVSGLDYKSVSLVQPEEKVKEIYEVVKKRLLNKKHWFVCMRCKKEIGTFRTKTVRERDLKCSNCGARTLGFVSKKDRKIAKKALNKSEGDEPLSEDEERVLKRLRKSSELFLDHDGKAPYVMGGYGIGPEAAKRIIMKERDDSEEVIGEVIEEERKFISTKQYWED